MVKFSIVYLASFERRLTLAANICLFQNQHVTTTVRVLKSLPAALQYTFDLIAVGSTVADYHSDSVDNTHFAEQ